MYPEWVLCHMRTDSYINLLGDEENKLQYVKMASFVYTTSRAPTEDPSSASGSGLRLGSATPLDDVGLSNEPI